MSRDHYVQLDYLHEGILGIWLDEDEAADIKDFILNRVAHRPLP